MNLPDVPLLSMLRQRMTWLHQRQDLLSQNVANADTPRYVSRDLKALNFDDAMKGVALAAPQAPASSRHIPLSMPTADKYADESTPDVESNPNGNAVSLEMEMIKVSDTQAQFQAAANLYSKAMTMMKTAIGH